MRFAAVYFKDFKLTLKDVTPKHIQDYYQYELNEKGLSACTVIHRHANIRKALQYAFKVGLIAFNPADWIERPKTAKFVGSIYDAGEFGSLVRRREKQADRAGRYLRRVLWPAPQ